MPYIKDDNYKREELHPFSHSPAECAGDLNFQITMLCLQYLRYNKINYQSMNDVLGALDGASKEFYRRVVSPYEDKKIKENGDVYDTVLLKEKE